MKVYSLWGGWFWVSGNVKYKWRQRNIQLKKKKSEANKEVCILNREVFTTHAAFLIMREATLTQYTKVFFFFFFLRNISATKLKMKVLCPTLSSSSVHRILQAKTLECVAISFSRRSFWPSNGTWVCHILGRFFTICATGDAPTRPKGHVKYWWQLIFLK